jgi:hypothetical protein
MEIRPGSSFTTRPAAAQHGPHVALVWHRIPRMDDVLVASRGDQA